MAALQSEDFEDESTPSFAEKLSELLQENKVPVVFVLIGLVSVGLGIFFTKGINLTTDKIEILETNSEREGLVVVEVAGAVKISGVYELEKGARVEDALILAGGITDDADIVWIEKVLNRAAKVTDGQKIYIPSLDESSYAKASDDKQSDVLSANSSGGDQSGSSSDFTKTEEYVNINSASASRLESLWGIGRVTAQNIIEQRPYSTVEELLSKKILKKNVYDRNKDLMTVY